MSAQTDTEPAFFSIADTATKLACGRSTIYALMDAGLLDSVKIGRLRRIPVASVERYIETLMAS